MAKPPKKKRPKKAAPKKKVPKKKAFSAAQTREKHRRAVWGTKGVDEKGGLKRVSGSGLRCRHGVQNGRCRACDPANRHWVYITGGGQRWHLFPDCKMLAAGQAKVARRGGAPEAIEAVSARSAENRDPCKECQRRGGGKPGNPVPGIRASGDMNQHVRRDRPIVRSSGRVSPPARCKSCGQAVKNCMCG